MKRCIVLYRSKYGATKRYAQWLSEALACRCEDVKNVRPQELDSYDTILLGGAIYASGISGISFLKKNFAKLPGKKWIVFCAGASPYDETAFAEVRRHNLGGAWESVPCFYCRGAWDESAMSLKDRTLCRMLQKAIAGKDPSEYEPWMTALMAAKGQACDWTDQKYLEPVLAAVREENGE